MRRAKLIMMFGLVLLGISALQAQQTNRLDTRTDKTALIDDKQSQELAKQNLLNERASVVGKISDLSEKQKTKILGIESCRNKKLERIDKCLERKKQYLKELELDAQENAKRIDRTKNAISKLAIKKQRVISKALTKIKSKLSPAQVNSL